MRFKLLLAGGLAAAGTFATSAPASAYCDALLSELTGRCTNGCVETTRTYHTADAKTGDKVLPDVEFICPM